MEISMLEQSFTARLKIMGRVDHPENEVEFSPHSEVMVITDVAGPDLDGTGWLVMGFNPRMYKATEVTMRFDLIDEATQRFSISCLAPQDFAGRRLDISRNGYLGFYAGKSDDAYWSLKVGSWGAGGPPVIQLHDRNGNVVRPSDTAYLVTSGSSRPAVSFDLSDYRPI
jgi:hypothetical protein